MAGKIKRFINMDTQIQITGDHEVLVGPVFAVQWHPERLCGAFARPESADGARLFCALLR